MKHWMRVAILAATSVVLLLGSPALAASSCLHRATLSQQAARPPLADARSYQPVNGTGGFSVFGAKTLDRLGFSVGLGYLGEQAVCQELDEEFDLNTVWLALAFGITDRLQIGVDVPYTWFEADKAGFDGSGVDDINLGVVYRFLDEGPARPGIAIVGFAAAPTGKRTEGIGRNEWDLGTKLAFSKTLPGGLLAHANVGYTYAGRGSVNQQDQFTSGAALELPLGKYFSLVTEGLADTNRRDDAERKSDWVAETRVGFRVRFAGFLLSVAGRKGLTNDAPDWGVFALLTYTYTPAPAEAAAPAPGPAAPPGVAPSAPGVSPAVPSAPGAPAGPAAPGVPAAPPGAVPGVPPVPSGPPVTAAVPPAALPPPLRSALRDINFEFDRSDLTEEARRSLEDLAQALKADRAFNVLIEGHADERGTAEYNLALGERRALAAKDYLVSLGVDAGRIDTISYGKERPLDPGHDELAWALNRRAHFTVRVRP